MKKYKLKKKNAIQIPKTICTLYCDKKNILTFIGPLQTKSLKIFVKVFFIQSLNLILVSDLPVNQMATNRLKHLTRLQGTTLSKIKQNLVETKYTLYHKLKFVGVGYRAFTFEDTPNQIYLKLGYSHLIYFKIASPLNTFCIKFTTLFVFGESSYETLTNTAAQIRNCKIPEPYKGKGILHYDEKIKLKRGKKI